MTLRAKMSNGNRYDGVPTGGEMFQEALDAFGGAENIRGITASWNTGELDTNLTKFNELIRGEPRLRMQRVVLGQAGRLEAEGGPLYPSIEMSLRNSDGTFREVMVYFTRPE